VKVVVVGAGQNGLVCAVRLRSAGVDVTVLEQGEHVGGAMTTVPGPLPGFRHDVCAGFLPLTRVAPAFDGIDLEVDWVVPETVMAHPLPDGSAIALERRLGATAESLEATAPGAGAAWARFMEPILRRHRTLAEAALGPFPALAPALRLAAALRLDAVRLAIRGLQPVARVGLDLFRDERAAAWLAGSTAHADLAPGDAGGGAFAIFLQMLGHAVGWPFPRGGVQAIADALARRAGDVRTGTAVEEVLVERDRVRGVRLAGGERIAADAVVVTTSARPFLEMLPEGALPGGVERRLARWRYSLGTFKVDFALDAPVPWTADECRRAGVVHVGGPLDAFARSFRESYDGRFPQEPVIVTGQHTLFDASRAPAGRHALYAYVRSPLVLDIPPETAADRVEEQIERFAPGFRALVLARVARGPSDLEAHDPSMIGGDLGGGDYHLDQQLFLRPHPRLFRTRTPIRGLYMASASAHPGGGVHGAQGLMASRAILAGR
jgi:phytoene dehydrogenase-like protein